MDFELFDVVFGMNECQIVRIYEWRNSYYKFVEYLCTIFRLCFHFRKS